MNFYKKLISVFSAVIFAGCSIVGYRTTEEPEFKVLLKESNFEIREYSPIIVAEYTSVGDYDSTTSKNFRALADYIFGNNVSKESISMSAPVFQESNTKIEMTAPVLQEKKNDSWTMQFTMPKKYSLDNLPLPKNEAIKFKEIPIRSVAVLEFSGFLSEKNIEENSTKLLKWIEDKDLKMASLPRYAGYDPPWTIPFMRRNEIQVEIKEYAPLKK